MIQCITRPVTTMASVAVTMQPNRSQLESTGTSDLYDDVSLTIAFAFTAMGFWVVLPFTALENGCAQLLPVALPKTLEYPGSFIPHPGNNNPRSWN